MLLLVVHFCSVLMYNCKMIVAVLMLGCTGHHTTTISSA